MNYRYLIKQIDVKESSCLQAYSLFQLRTVRFRSHTPVSCTTAALMTRSLAPASSSAFYKTERSPSVTHARPVCSSIALIAQFLFYGSLFRHSGKRQTEFYPAINCKKTSLRIFILVLRCDLELSVVKV